MKKIALFLSLIIAPLSSTLSSEPPTSYPDVVSIPPAIVSLRSMQTGEPVRNNEYSISDPRNINWEMLNPDVQQSFADVRDNGIFVQFRVVEKPNLCFNPRGTTICQDSKNSIFVLIPTESGAVAMKNLQGECVVSRNYRTYSTEPCGKSLKGQVLELPFLWAITPPFGKGKLLTAPTK
ncbi:hypothetical protein B0187_05150 [Haemophilus paracuniculus]|uniref:Toxin n=1 Tax=Haemophilus paracuniculus TaxID=734 RepID=A0A1T0ASH7_9PAST|nr:hypothetical protein [Haemophilus paracuniculus]OOR99148.1 hypothetical protein B0187_05150 [Haemophilus paracuniculus]